MFTIWALPINEQKATNTIAYKFFITMSLLKSIAKKWSSSGLALKLDKVDKNTDELNFSGV